MRRRGIIVVLVIAVVAALAFVVYNGSQGSSRSNLRSNNVVVFIQTYLVPEEAVTFHTWYVVVRKAAHVIEYALLSTTLLSLMLFAGASAKTAAVTTAVTGVVLGCADEYYQSVIDRTAQLTDALGYDQLGNLLGILIAFWIASVVKRHRALMTDAPSPPGPPPQTTTSASANNGSDVLP